MRDRNAFSEFSEFVTYFHAKERKMNRSLNRMSCFSRLALLALCVAAVLLAGSTPAQAATKYLEHRRQRPLLTASNWNATGVPASTDTVLFNNTGGGTATIAGSDNVA